MQIRPNIDSRGGGRAFASHADGWVFESQPRQTEAVKTGIDSSTAKRLAIGVCVTGPRGLPLLTEAPCPSRHGKEPSLLNGHEC